MATKIFLKKDNNQTVATLPNWASAADIFGATGGNELVNIHATTSDLSNFSAGAMTLDQNIEGVYLSQALTAYQFAANGNQVSISLGGTVIAKVTVQDDTDGTQITYAGSNTPIALTIAATNSGFAVNLGTQTLTTTPLAYGESGTPSTPSADTAPWTLVMKANDNYNMLVSNGTADGTNTTNTDSAYSLTASADANESYWTTNKRYDSNLSTVYDLWTVSGTNTTPTKLADISSSSLGTSYDLAGFTLFTSGDYYGSKSLTATDGTTANTFNTNINGTILEVDTTNNVIWHTINTAPYGTELYRTTLNSTGFTTELVKDIYAGSNGSFDYYDSIESALLPDGKLVFRANDGITSSYGIGEAFVSDGTEAGTISLDLYQGSWYSDAGQFTSFGNKVVVSAGYYDGTTYAGRELVFTDGTTAGTKVLDVYAGGNSSDPTILREINGLLYFTATDAAGKGIFSTDGTTFTKKASISTDASLLGYSANKAYFAVTTTANGKELWSEDLANDTFTLAKDILAGSGSGLVDTYSTTMIGDKILFNAYTSGTTQAMFISDGTEAGTVQLSTNLPTDTAVMDGKVFFANSEGIYSAGVLSTTPTATQLKASVATSGDVLQSDSDQAFFLGSDEKLYVSTGTDAIQLASNVDKFKVVSDNAIYFIETSSSNVSSLWYSDGTATGTRYIEDLGSGGYYYDYYQLENAVAIHTIPFDEAGDFRAPTLYNAQVNGTSLTLTFGDASALDATNTPPASAFALTGTSATVSSVAVNASAKTVTLTLSESVKSTDVISLAYTDPSTNNDTAALQDALGNDVASITGRSVRNMTPDNEAPVIASATISGNSLVISYTDSSALDAVNVPSTSAFALTGTTATVTGMNVDGANKTVTLTLSAEVLATDVISLSYTDPTAGNDTAAIQDVLGNDAATASNVSVTNNTPVKAPWTLVMETGSKNGSILVTNGANIAFYDGNPNNFIVSTDANEGYWVNSGSKNGGQLWTVSGTNTTPTKLADINSDYLGTPYDLAGFTLFTYRGNLVATDGTSANTFNTNINGTILEVDSVNNVIWHTINTAPYGTELYRTTLTSTGFSTEMVKDIYAGSTGSDIGESALLPDGKLVFRANDGVTGNWEAFVSDGTEAGTISLDLYQGSSYSYPNQFTNFGNQVVVSAYYDNGTYTGYELVFTDGTTAGTKVLDVYAGSSSSSPTILGEINGLLYFTATDATGKGIFSTNGTTFTKKASISSNDSLLGYSANKAYFVATTAENGAELWSADLATGTFTLAKDILAGSGSGLTGNLNQTMIGDKILFNAYTSGTNQALFISDGTEAGTVQLSTNLPTDTAVMDGKVFFANSEGIYSAGVLSTTPVAEQLVSGVGTGDALQSDKDQAFFVGGDKKFYVSTGTEAGTVQLAANVDKFKVVSDNAIYFIETNSSNVSSLWYSDGTTTGTRYIEDLTLSASSYDLENAVAIHTVGVSAG
jgi:uncharacterized repeat protein (TIGR02059 family)